MAIELGAAYISILPSTDKLAAGIKKELAASEASARVAGDRAGSGFASNFKAKLGGALKGGLFAGLAGGSLLAGAGLQTAAELEQSRIGFETMLGSAQKAEAFLQQIQDTAAKTPFELPGLTQASQKLLAFGFGAKDVIPTLTTLGDAASGLGLGQEGLDRIIMAVGQIQAKGKAQGEELLQLTEAGIPAQKILQNELGLTADKFAEMSQKGQLSADKVIPALLNGIQNGSKGIAGETAKFGGLMAKQSQSLSGLFSTLKDTVLVGIAQEIEPLMPMLKSGLAGAIKFAGAAIPAFANGIKSLVAWIRSAVQWGKEHSTLLFTLGTIVAAVTAGVVAYRVVVGTIAAATRLWAAAQRLLNLAMKLNPVGLVIGLIVGLGVALVAAYKKSETFRNIVNAAFAKVKSAGQAVANFFTKTIPSAFGKVRDAAGSALGWVKANWPKILAVLTGPIGLAVYAIAKNWSKIKAGAAAAKDWIVEKWDALIGFFRGLPGRITSAASGMWNGIRNSFQDVINDIIGWWNNLSFSLDIPDKIPGLPDSFTIGTPNIPYLAKGGLLTGPTLNVAGEAGPEAVIPLDRLESWIARAAAVGASNVNARAYANPDPTRRRTEFVITNWRTGEGYFREIAEDTYHGETAYAGTTRRMR